MTKGNATLAALLFAFGSASTYAAPAQPKPGRNAVESIANMTELVCREITPIVADALAEAFNGKTRPQVAKYLTARATKDEKAGEKYYPTILDPKQWGNITAGAVSGHAAKIKAKYPNNPGMYAESVDQTRTTFYETCLKDYPTIMKDVYGQSAKAK